MIQVNELRIGNLVFDKNGSSFKINGVLEGSVFKKDAYIGTPIDWIKPIPLTEEWLLKFGFEKISYKMYINGNTRTVI